MKTERYDFANRASALRREFDAAFAEAARDEKAGLIDFLSIRVAGDAYAVRLADVLGLHADRKVVRVPTRTRELLGVAGFRGVIAPVYDLRVLLGYPVSAAHSTEAAPRWLILARGASPVALAFDRFEAQLRVEQSAVSQSSEPEQRGPTSGAVRAENVDLSLLDLGYLLQQIIRRAKINGPTQER
jgi:purine-binding chemotaxis protein CheW